MRVPKMILFDYGETLCHSTGSDFLRGERAVFAHLTENPHHVTPEQAYEHGLRLFTDAEASRRVGYEVHEWPLLRLKYESLGLRFDLPLPELEILLADEADPVRLLPGAADMLADLRARGIRTGVISNLGWSGNMLETRLKRLLPDHRFEFVLSSSEYALRKPHPLLFKVALEKAHLEATEVWYIGDSLSADINGARNAGLTPVMYLDESVSLPHAARDAAVASYCPVLHRWRDLATLLTEGADR